MSAPARRAVARLGSLARRPVALLLLGTGVGQGAVLAASPLLTRLYSPADLGVLALVTSLAAIGGAVSTTGWDRAVVGARSDALARALVGLAGMSTLVVTVVVAVLSGALRHRAAEWLRAPALVELWWVLPLVVALIGAQRTVAAVLTRRRAWRSAAARSAAQGLGQVATSVLLAPAGGALGLVLGLAAGRAAGLLGSASGRPRRPSSPRRGARSRLPSRRAVATAARRYRRFPLVSTWSGLLNSAGLQLPTAVLAAAAGPVALGFVALGSRVVATPVGLLAEVLGQHVDGRVGALVRSRGPGLTRLVVTSALRTGAAGVAGAGAVAAASPLVVVPVFGAAWAPAVPYVQLLAVSCAAQLAVVPVGRVLTLLERQGRQLCWDAARLVATLGSVVVAAGLGVTPVQTVAALVTAGTASYGALLLLVVAAARRHDREAEARSPAR